MHHLLSTAHRRAVVQQCGALMCGCCHSRGARCVFGDFPDIVGIRATPTSVVTGPSSRLPAAAAAGLPVAGMTRLLCRAALPGLVMLLCRSPAAAASTTSPVAAGSGEAERDSPAAAASECDGDGSPAAPRTDPAAIITVAPNSDRIAASGRRVKPPRAPLRGAGGGGGAGSASGLHGVSTPMSARLCAPAASQALSSRVALPCQRATPPLQRSIAATAAQIAPWICRCSSSSRARTACKSCRTKADVVTKQHDAQGPGYVWCCSVAYTGSWPAAWQKQMHQRSFTTCPTHAPLRAVWHTGKCAWQAYTWTNISRHTHIKH